MKRILMLTLIMVLFASVVFGADQWDKDQLDGGISVSDIDYYNQINNEAQDRMLSNYRDGVEVSFASTSTITVSAGEIACPNAAGSVIRYRKNTAATTVDITSNTYWDTGAEDEDPSTTYYLYALADTDATTFTVILSTNASTPTGTYYKRIGSFYNDASSNIDRTKVYNQPYRPMPTDSSGAGIITAIYDYNTSASSFTAKFSSMKVAYGTQTISNTSNQAITNLPFSSSSSYVVSLTEGETTTVANELLKYVRNSGGQFTIYNAANSTLDIGWIAIGQ